MALIYASPIGKLYLAAHTKGLYRLRQVSLNEEALEKENAIETQAARELDAYFAGKLKEFSVPLDFQGAPFRQRVWQAMMRVSYGTTAHYKDLASAAGSPLAFRAAGGAMAANPIAIIGPCHRILATDGSLGGYSWGLDAKRFLLRLERVETRF